jgi:DNA-binding MarR family transcriptional regulator
MSRRERILESIDLMRRNQVLTQMLDEQAAGYLGINTTDARALDVIDQHGRITAGDLARELRLSTGAVTALVDRLERAGYAKRTHDPDDRRRVLLEVTPTVYALSAKVYGTPEDAITWADAFSDAEIDVLVRYQRLGREWLEERLARIERLNAERRDRKARKRLTGRGQA